MFDLGHFITGLLVAALAVLFIKYNYQVVGLVGHQDWIENKLGSGSTYGVFKILGVLIIIGALLYATGLSDPVLSWLLSPLINVIAPGN